MTEKNNNTNSLSEEDKIQKIQALRDTINSAEKTIQSAKAMLLQLEGKKKTGRRKKIQNENEDGNIIYGTFDGQLMIGNDGKQYPVPPNYASKSKLVEGDMLKLTITEDGFFLYKQVGPVERKQIIGIATQDKNNNYFIMAEGKPYKVLLASVTYFQVEPGDEVAIVIPRDGSATWAAIENVVRKVDEINIVDNNNVKNDNVNNNEENEKNDKSTDETDITTEKNTEEKKEEKEKKHLNTNNEQDDIDEWTADIEEIKKEIESEEKEKKEIKVSANN